MKKLLALLMALAMVFTLAACGGNDEPETTTQAPEVESTEDVNATVENDTTEAADASTEAATGETESTEAVTGEEKSSVAEEESSAAADASNLSKAEFVAFLNAETAKIAKSGKYSVNRNCKYTKNIDVGGATDTLNDIIKGIDENSSLDTVVGDFLGIGTTTGNVPKDDVKGDYKVMATSLKESDVSSFSVNNGVYSFTLANATNPKKTASTPFARFTNDFITHEEVVEGIADFTGAIKVKETTVNYTKINVKVTVADGKITNIQYSYAFDAQLALTALVVPINGTGAAVTNTTYSNIKY